MIFKNISGSISKRAVQAYQFHKSLKGGFGDVLSLLQTALPEMQRLLKLDRVYFFDLLENPEIMSLSILCKDYKCIDMQENVFIENRESFVKGLKEKGLMLSEDLSYPAVYVLLKWKTLNSYNTGESGAGDSYKDRFGVLRLERLNKRKKFSDKDIEFMLALAGELSQNLLSTETDNNNAKRFHLANGLNELATIFAKSLRFTDGIELILKGVQKYFKFDRARLYLFDYKGENVTALMSTDISGEVVITTENITKQDAVDALESDIFHTSKALVLPLSVQGKRVGVLILDNILSRRDISQMDFLSLKQFSYQIALSIDNAVLFERVQDLYNYDELTKLPVRRYFMEKLEEEIYRSKRFDLGMSLIIMDIDWFKEINDTFGHSVGDHVLKEVSRVIMSSLRQTDFPCRFGGDEMLIMLPRTSAQEAKFIAKRLADRIKSISLPMEMTNGKDFHVSVTQGISIFPDDASDSLDLINKADKALYHAKKIQRGTYSFYREAAEAEPDHAAE
ncbi:diguanylate cyclase (GGDEF) domain-containing protein [Parelusimicrobium proximum]|uniref:sensor domain-containing diguanylate cyclase n=1 Tax=Parelusimicrobium proximum TaxID=3228953 RepID=UPI003D182C14